METTAPMAERAAQFRDAYARVRAEINKVIVGHQDVVDGVLTCLFVGGHCLLEGVPGLGKTLLVRTLSQVLDLKFSRVQFTPDLMPSDIIGTNIISEAVDTNRFIRCGASPRGAQSLVLAAKVRALLQGRYNVSFEDIRSAYLPALRHRVLLNFEAQAENIPSDQVLAGILNEVKEKAPEGGM